MPNRSRNPTDLMLWTVDHIRDIDGNNRCHFVIAVAFEKIETEFGPKGVGQGGRQGLGADHGVAQASKIFVRGMLHVGLAVGGGAQQQGHLAIARHDVAHHISRHRVGIVHHTVTGDDGEPQGQGPAKGVMQRQDAKQTILDDGERPDPDFRDSKEYCGGSA